MKLRFQQQKILRRIIETGIQGNNKNVYAKGQVVCYLIIFAPVLKNTFNNLLWINKDRIMMNHI